MKIYDAVINIGSNSVKLLAPSDGLFNFRHSITTQLALGSKNGILAQDAIERTAAAAKELCDACRQFCPRNVYIYGTESVRSAKNAAQLTDKIKLMTEKDVDVIDAQTEALLSFLGAKNAVSQHFDALLDIGGASTELMCAENSGGQNYARSLPIGAVRLYDICDQDYEKAERTAYEYVSEFSSKTLPVIVGASGTFNTLAIIAQNLKTYTPEKIHGYTFTADDLSQLTKSMLPLSPAQICERHPLVSIKRANVLKAGMAILNAFLRAVKGEKVIISVSDGLEGYLIHKRLT